MTKRVILYSDYFSPNNSNFHWLRNFKESPHFDEVIQLPLDAFSSRDQALSLIRKFEPIHIHFGGSVKQPSYAPIHVLKSIRKKNPHIRLSALYGDVYANAYVVERAIHTDANHVSNASLLDPNLLNLFSSKGLFSDPGSYHSLGEATNPSVPSSLYYFPTPTDPGWYDTPIPNEKKDIDVVFAGNNYSGRRRQFLQYLTQYFNLHIAGGNWKKEDFKNSKHQPTLHGTTTLEETVKLYHRAKVIVDDPNPNYCRFGHITKECLHSHKKPIYRGILCNNDECSSFQAADSWFSNRGIIALYSGTPFVATKRLNQEQVLTSPIYINDSIFDNLDHQKTSARSHISSLLNNFDTHYYQSLQKSSVKEAAQFTFQIAIDKLVNHNRHRPLTESIY